MLDIETILPTPTGLTKLKFLKEGDQLFDEQGNICEIIKINNSNENSYKIIFDDEVVINSSIDHKWSAWNRSARKSYSNSNNPTIHPKFYTTKEILQSLKINNETNFSIENIKPLNYSQKDLIIPPYILGCWLGDGRKDNGSIECADQSILDNIQNLNYSINKTNNISISKSSNYRIGDRVENNEKSSIGLLKKQLRNLNLLNNKHIPNDYLNSSSLQRLNLLQGLMDTDGSCDNRGLCEFISVNEKLANQTLQLINSLGIKTRIHKNESWIYGTRHQDRYRILFITKLKVFKLERKLERLKKSNNQITRNTHRYIKTIEPILHTQSQMRSIIVNSKSNLYIVTKNFIPTSI